MHKKVLLKKLVAAAVFFYLSLLLVACSDAVVANSTATTTSGVSTNSNASNPSVANPSAPLPTLAVGPNPHIGYATAPVAKVGDQTISADDFNHALDQARIAYEQENGGIGKIDWTTTANQQTLQDLRGQTLEGLINYVVVAQAAAKENVMVSDAEVQSALDDFKKQLGNAPDAYTTYLAQHYITDADERNELKQTTLFEKMQDKHSTDVQTSAEQVHVRFILLATKAEAMSIYNQLHSGADFAQLAKQFSLDPGTASKGGDLGFIWQGEDDPAFDKEAFALQTNAFSPPIQTNLGWNIIQSLGKENRPLPFDLIQQRKSDAFAAYIKTLRDQTQIEEYLKP